MPKSPPSDAPSPHREPPSAGGGELLSALHAAGNRLASLVLKSQRVQAKAANGPLGGELDGLVVLAFETMHEFQRARDIVRASSPLPPPAKKCPEPTLGPVDMAPHKLRALVVDDDSSIRAILRDVLVSEGLQVDIAATVDAGLRLFETNRHHMVFTDFDLGASNGADFAARIKGTAPGVRTILMTGWAIGGGPSDAIDRILPKPFRINDVQKLVRELQQQRN